MDLDQVVHHLELALPLIQLLQDHMVSLYLPIIVNLVMPTQRSIPHLHLRYIFLSSLFPLLPILLHLHLDLLKPHQLRPLLSMVMRQYRFQEPNRVRLAKRQPVLPRLPHRPLTPKVQPTNTRPGPVIPDLTRRYLLRPPHPNQCLRTRRYPLHPQHQALCLRTAHPVLAQHMSIPLGQVIPFLTKLSPRHHQEKSRSLPMGLDLVQHMNTLLGQVIPFRMKLFL